MLKKDEITNPKSCLNKAADNEPVFVLRAQDDLAADIVREWAWRAEIMAGLKRDNPKLIEAYALADQMEAWPNRKSPD